MCWCGDECGERPLTAGKAEKPFGCGVCGEKRPVRSPEPGEDFAGGKILPVALQVINRCKGPAAHAVELKVSVEVVDFMLEDAGVPAGAVDGAG